MHDLYLIIVLFGALCNIFLTSLVVGGWLLEHGKARLAYRQYRSHLASRDESH